MFAQGALTEQRTQGCTHRPGCRQGEPTERVRTGCGHRAGYARGVATERSHEVQPLDRTTCDARSRLIRALFTQDVQGRFLTPHCTAQSHETHNCGRTAFKKCSCSSVAFSFEDKSARTGITLSAPFDVSSRQSVDCIARDGAGHRTVCDTSSLEKPADWGSR